MRRLLIPPAVLAGTVLLAACGSGSNTGVNVYVADGPVEGASSVVVTLTGITLNGDTGTQNYPFPSPTPISLLSLQGGLSLFLINVQPPAGHYTSVTVSILAAPNTTDSSISFPGLSGALPLYIPAGQPTSFTVPINIVVTKNNLSSLTLDFDLRKSVLPDPGNPNQYILQPSLRGVNNDLAGSITGQVANSLITPGCTPAVYVYSGQVTPADININAPAGSVQPLSTASVGINTTTSLYNFTAGFLPAGQYTLAMTCQAAQDNPATSDNLAFSSVITASVSAGQTSFVSMQ